MYNQFLNKDNKIAIVGVSNDKDKWGRKIFDKLLEADYKVVPVNPKYKQIEESTCYSNLKEIPFIVDLVITVVPPEISFNVIRECKQLGIEMIWMQPGSESDEALDFCEKNNLECISNACFVVDGMKTKFCYK
ncbi:CoA-binding protein [Candidatus Dojkabacteria bacterium]|nr:CoA-binding protein [Candidatus Dojkabacteria bacterium]